MSSRISWLLAAPLWFCSGAALAGPVEALAGLKATEREALAQSSQLRRARIQAQYEREVRPQLHPQSLASLDDTQLAAVLEATSLTVFHTGSKRHVQDMERLVHWLSSARPLTTAEATLYFRALVRAREFEEAASLARRFALPEVEPVPYLRIDDPRAPGGAYRISASKPVLWPLRPALSGTRLLVVVHPLCTFSRRAEAALARMSREVPTPTPTPDILRLAPPGERLFLEVLRQWNALHPGNEMLLARHESDWPMIDDWATPNFYLLQDGRVIDHFSGWPPEGNEARLRQMYAAYERCLSGGCPAD